jgi:hypothetical protein
VPKAPGVRQFVVGRNPDPDSRLPYLLRLPVEGQDDVVLATAVRWPGPKDAFCYELGVWPPEAEVLEQVPVESCRRLGAAVHLVLRRSRQRRSLFVWTAHRRTGRRLIFWRTAATMGRARPGIRIPQARGLERALDITVDRRERYAWSFRRYAVTLERRELPVGDYGVLADGRLVAAVERKSVADLARSATAGTLATLLADLERIPYAALVVEGRLSDLIKEGHQAGVRPGWLLNVVAALQVAHPRVAWLFAETRDLAQDWAYRWLAACVHAARGGAGAPAVRAPLEAAEVGPDWPAGGAALLDAGARREFALARARQGEVWTHASLAAACGVTAVTAAKDLRALAAKGLLVAEGGRPVRYRAP